MTDYEPTKIVTIAAVRTTLHWAIEAAAVLGARKIYVVGADAKGLHMHKHGSRYRRLSQSQRPHPQWRAGTRSLAKALELFGVKIVRYTYGRGEHKV